MSRKANVQRRLIREDLRGDLFTPPVAEPSGTVVVYGASVLGGEWLEAYDAQRFEDKAAVFRLQLVPDKVHPRLVLPFAILLWGAGGAPTFERAADVIAGQHLAETLAIVDLPTSLPLPCGPTGRCVVRIVDGRLTSRPSGDEAEAVVAALTHGGSCRWWPGPRAKFRVLDWAERWISEETYSVADDALRTAAILLETLEAERPALLDRLAGGRSDETRLRQLYLQRDGAWRHGRAFDNHKRLNHHGSRGACGFCGSAVHPSTAACGNCAVYPHGPDPRSTALDRLELALGVSQPARLRN